MARSDTTKSLRDIVVPQRQGTEGLRLSATVLGKVETMGNRAWGQADQRVKWNKVSTFYCQLEASAGVVLLANGSFCMR